MTAPNPWRPWEGCMTLNDHWGYHHGDHNWKSPLQVLQLLQLAANGRGNLLLNIGPRGDGSVPQESVRIIREVGRWLSRCGECFQNTDPFTFGLMQRGQHNGDWSHQGPFTLSGRTLYQLLFYWPGTQCTLAGLNTQVQRVTLLGESGPRDCAFTQNDGVIRITGLPDLPPDPLCPVLRLDCADVPKMYLTGGMRVPRVPHPPYDPMTSDLAHAPT